MCRSNRAAKVPGVFRAYGKSFFYYSDIKRFYTLRTTLKASPKDLKFTPSGFCVFVSSTLCDERA